MFPSAETLSAFKATQKPFIASSVVEKKPFVAQSTIEVNSAKIRGKDLEANSKPYRGNQKRVSHSNHLRPTYFYTCAAGGVLACGLTHYTMTPVDMLKCRMQVNKSMYNGIFDGFKKVAAANGIKGLFLGGAPTLIGYSLQGMGKYGFYEYFKYLYANVVGAENAAKYKTFLFLGASASAEFIADIMLCPMEALKVKMQTSATPFATSFLGGVRKIHAAEGINGFYKGLAPLWMRQIPYTMVKFATFEKTVDPRSSTARPEQLGVTAAAGYFAGIFCAIVSHPADTLVSKLNNVAKAEGESTGAIAMRILKDLGFTGVWAGLGPRIFMIGTLTALQWFIYDSFKVQTGLPTTGGAAAPKKDE
ncbi:mitochondrial carrier [Linderina pennispora]|uniref:Mitochondrial carrier n=1 Tax=Linderina pennispora TaxID=61395 RepID=A0A1Y1W0A3_9FUNG|nr:mitochondrial carrier [Linderina pennispora]ORX66948.1 mitochondrial carrier [Linderina pennispora]